MNTQTNPLAPMTFRLPSLVSPVPPFRLLSFLHVRIAQRESGTWVAPARQMRPTAFHPRRERRV